MLINLKKTEMPTWFAMTLSFLLSFLPRILLTLQAVPFRTISDETATIAGGAYLAGLDWSMVVSHAGYYGSGFTILLSPIFWLTDNPFIIYRFILGVACVLQSLTAMLSFYMMKHYFKIKETWFLCIASVACSYMVVTRTSVVFNEHMIILCAWLVALLLCKLVEHHTDKFKKRIDTLLLFVVLSYSLTLHTRAVTMWLSLGVCLFLFYFMKKVIFISIPVAGMIGIIGALIGFRYIRLIQEKVWQAGQSNGLRNATVAINANFDVTSFHTWKAWFGIIFGQINTIMMLTGGLLLIIFVRLVLLFVEEMKVRKSAIQVDKINNRAYFIILFLFFTLCIGGTIFAQSLLWLDGAMAGVREGAGTQQYGVKAFTYVRYFGPYVGPLFMAGIAALYHKAMGKMEIRFVIITGSILQVVWFFLDFPYVFKNSKANEPFVPLSLLKQGEQTTWSTYLPASILLVLLLSIFILSLYRNKKWISIGLIALFLLYQNSYAMKYDIAIANKNLQRAKAGYVFMTKQESKIAFPHTIYVKDSTNKTDHQIFYLYQFLLNRYQVIPDLPEDSIESAVVFCNSPEEKNLLLRGYEVAKLDRNEFIYAKGNLLSEIKENTTLSFQKSSLQ